LKEARGDEFETPERRHLGETSSFLILRGAAVCQTPISAPASGYGSGFNRTPLTTLKTALLVPTPMAMVSTVTTVNIGERIRRRTT